MSPLSLISHGASQNHHRLLNNPQMGSLTNLMSQELEQRMLEYFKMITPKESARKSRKFVINSILD